MKESTITLWIEYDRLDYLNKLRKKRQQIEEEEIRLSTPNFSDVEKLSDLYQKFREELLTLPKKLRPDWRAARKMFIFIALYLYSPSALVGKRIDSGIRLALAEVMGFSSPTLVTYHCDGVGIWCTAYPGFKRILDYIYPRVISEFM